MEASTRRGKLHRAESSIVLHWASLETNDKRFVPVLAQCFHEYESMRVGVSLACQTNFSRAHVATWAREKFVWHARLGGGVAKSITCTGHVDSELSSKRVWGC